MELCKKCGNKMDYVYCFCDNTKEEATSFNRSLVFVLGFCLIIFADKTNLRRFDANILKTTPQFESIYDDCDREPIFMEFMTSLLRYALMSIIIKYIALPVSDCKSEKDDFKYKQLPEEYRAPHVNSGMVYLIFPDRKIDEIIMRPTVQVDLSNNLAHFEYTDNIIVTNQTVIEEKKRTDIKYIITESGEIIEEKTNEAEATDNK